jgi:hypothetical protein
MTERWIVAVTRFGKRVCYANVPSYDSACKNKDVALQRGYKDAQVMPEAEFRRLFKPSEGSEADSGHTHQGTR